MDNPEPQFNQPQTDTTELDERYDALQYLVTSMLGLLTLLAAVLAVFLWRQQSDKGFELANFTPQANNFVAQYERGPGPAQREFLRKIAEYARAHPDFAPILNKYHIKPEEILRATPATPMPATPAPAATLPGGTKK